MSLFKRLLKGNLNLKKTPKQKGDQDDGLKYYPEDSLAIDERFTNNFRKNRREISILHRRSRN